MIVTSIPDPVAELIRLHPKPDGFPLLTRVPDEPPERWATLSIDYQQAASEASRYARMEATVHATFPDGSADTQGLREGCMAICRAAQRLPLESQSAVSCDLDSGPTFGPGRSGVQTAVMTFLLTVPTTGEGKEPDNG